MSQVPPNYTNYPRPNYQTDPFSRPPGVYLDVVGDAWKLVSKELGTWVLSALIALIVGGVITAGLYIALVAVILGTGAIASQSEANPIAALTANLGFQFLANLATVLPFALMYLVPVGMANMAVRQVRGMPIGVGDIFLVFSRFGPVFGALALSMLAYTVGAYLLLIPGLYAAAAFSLSPLIALNHEVGSVEAMKLSAKALGSQAWMMILVLVILTLLVSLGGCLCGIGALFTAPIAAAGVGLHYHYFFPPVTNAPYVPMSEAPRA